MTNRIKAGDMKIEYFSTLDIIVYQSTNKLQRSLLQNFRNLILGIEEADVLMYNTKVIEFIKEKKKNNHYITNSIKDGRWEKMSVLESKEENTYKQIEIRIIKQKNTCKS